MLHVATSMFEDADKDSDQNVSKAEFVRWAMNHGVCGLCPAIVQFVLVARLSHPMLPVQSRPSRW